MISVVSAAYAASSKGLSIGCLLAAFEKRATGDRAGVRVGMAHVESRRYEAAQLLTNQKYQLISVWIAGECYSVPTSTTAGVVEVEAQAESPRGTAVEVEKVEDGVAPSKSAD